MNRWRRFSRPVLIIIGSLGVGLAIYLSLKTSSRMTAVHWLPQWITRWADAHGQFRNFPAFALLAAPFLLVVSQPRRRLLTLAALGLLIVSLELLQRRLPERSPDVWDVVWGWAGLGFAWMIAVLIGRFRRRHTSKLVLSPMPRPPLR